MFNLNSFTMRTCLMAVILLANSLISAAQSKKAFVEVTEDTTASSARYITRRGCDSLQWSDFQGKVKTQPGFEALTVYTFQYGMTSKVVQGQTQVKVRLACLFDKEKSWNLGPNYSPALLEHERTHFRIAVWYFLQMKSAIKSREFPASTANREIEKIYRQYSQECHDIQIRYDEETHHGTETAAQQQWEADIRAQLAALGDL